MKVAIEARALNSSTTAGVKTYARELIRNLREIGGAEYEIISDNPSAWQLPWWMNVTLPLKLRQINPDVVHYTKSVVPFGFAQGKPTVVTIHDIIPIFFPSSQARLQRLLWPQTLRQAALKSDHVITVSESSKRDIVEHLNVLPEKVTVTPEAVDLQRYHPTSILPSPEGRKYILFVGTRDMRKNVPLLIRAFARIAEDIPHQLIIAGRQALRQDQDKRQAHELGLDDRVTWLDFVPDSDLPALYADADLFVWPSVYEGWGLPPMEAMASGVPVIVSNGGALPEVVGSAGEIVPFSEIKVSQRMWDMPFEEALAARMLAVLEDEKKRKVMREMGLDRVKQFSWRAVAEKTLEVYKKTARV